MAKTKQQKFTESLRQSQANTFSEGLNMDLHPLSTPNTVMTDCVNGTMITYNDNEFVLQNERGNSEIKIGDAEYVKLSEGFIPVGMKEHNGILYIVSHNPQTKQSEIGTYPSPKKVQEHGVNLVFEGNGEIKSNYTEFDQNIIYYDYNIIVTNQDNYIFSSSYNPLVVLEHFILNKTGEVTKTKLIGIEGTETYNFTHEGEGTLGYRYRPYYLSSITPSIIPSKEGDAAQLIIEAISDDKELYEVLKTQDNIKFKYDIVIEFVNGENKLEFKSESLNIDNWDYTFNLTNVSKLSLEFENKFTIKNEDGDIECEYNYRTGELITTKNVDGNQVENIYKEVNFNIIPCIYTSDDNYITYDNLITNYKTTADVVFKQVSWFSTFKYKSQDESSNKLSILATLDLSRFDIDWETNVQTINESSYKLYEIDKYGNIRGKYVNTPFTGYKSPLFNIVDSKLDMKSHDLVFNDKQYNFLLSDVETLIPIQYSNSTTSQCVNLTSENKARYVRYDKVNNTTYNVVLLNANYEELSSTNVYSYIACNEYMEKMIDEYFDKTNGKVDYIINDVSFEYNKVYLLELTFPINEKINKASFVIVTAQSLLDKYNENDLEQRMDEILLTEWFKPSVDEVSSIKQEDYINPSSYINNLIDVERIKDKTDDEIEKYAMQFFLKYNQLFTNPTDNEIPALGEQFNCEKTIKNTSAFDCTFEYNYTLNSNEFNVKKIIINALSLDVDVDKSKFYTQTSERKYLYDIFNVVNEVVTKCDGAYSDGTVGLTFSQSPINTAISINNHKLGETNMFSLGWTNWLDDGRMEIESQYNCTKVTKDNCRVTKSGDFAQYYTWNTAGKAEPFGGPVQILYKSGLNGGLNYSNIKDADNVDYSGQNKKIFIHSKHHDKKAYMLLGIDGLNDSEENSKLACNVLLKHGYYTKQCNKQVYQYVFKIENDVIKTKNIKTENTSIPIKIYPGQCNALFKDFSQYNVQNWNNLSTHFSSNYIINKFDVNDNIIDNEDVYKYFLEKLGMIINSQLFDNTIFQEQINDNIIQFDVKTDNLFIDDVNKINNKEGRDYSNIFYEITMPKLLYDKENKIIYCNITNDTVDKFEYIGGNCIRPLDWNYSMPFDTNDGFWPDGSLDNIEKLNVYHSLLFYKLTTYNGDQSQNSN